MGWRVGTRENVVPFDRDGNLLHYPTGVVEWRPLNSFCTALFFVCISRGRSAAYSIWKDAEGHEYPMSLADLADVINTRTLVTGCVANGVWTFRKRGQNFGIALLNPTMAANGEGKCLACGRAATQMNYVEAEDGTEYVFSYCSNEHFRMHYPFDKRGVPIAERMELLGLAGKFQTPAEVTS